MKTSDIILSIIIIFIFVGVYAFNIFTVGIEKIKKNWPQYRCNPTIMPFASMFGENPVQNFTYCIQNMQTSYMKILLQPTNYMFSLITNSLGGLVNTLNIFRQKIAILTSNISNVIQSIFGVFINILVQFQYLLIKIKDTIGKLLGIAVTTIYMVDSTVQTGQSVWNGPVGGTIRFICFHPETEMKLSDGTSKNMKDIEIGDILHNNKKVTATMKIKPNDNNPYYRIFSKELDKYIYVTGMHTMMCPDTNKYIYVKDYKESEFAGNTKTEFMNCIVTEDHLINIGEYTFWDWED